VDWLPSTYPNDLVDELSKRDDFYSNPGWATYYYRFNTQRPPFTDARVRQAFNLAIDRRLLVEQVLRLGQVPAYHFVPPGVAGYERPASAITHDVARARQLLVEAGYPDGQGIPEIGVLYNTNEAHKKIAEFVADELRRNIGVSVKAYNQEWQSFLVTSRNLDYDMARAAWVGDYLDPNTFLDMWVTNGGNNQTGFSSTRYDRLISASANIVRALDDRVELRVIVSEKHKFDELVALVDAAADPELRVARLAKLRLALLAEAERILVREDFPIMPVYFYVVSGLISPRFGGFYHQLELPDGTRSTNVTDQHPLDEIFLKKDQ
jgi:oligopeptide transport system substrate-binding protein